jgi:hypothetical protein
MNLSIPFRFFLLGGVLLFPFFLLPFFYQTEDMPSVVPFTLPEKKKTPIASSQIIFDEKPQFLSPEFPEGLKELNIFLLPSFFQEKPLYQLSLGAHAETINIEDQNPIFLSFEGGRLHRSTQEKPFFIQILELSENKATLLVQIERPNQVAIKKTIQLPVKVKKENIQRQKEFQNLSKAKYLGEDLLWAKVYPEKPARQRLILGSQLISLARMQCLIYDGGKWKASDSIPSKGLVAKIKNAPQSQGLSVEGWDLDTNSYYQFDLTHYAMPSLQLPFKDVLQKIRVRNHSQISCEINGERQILKLGDALVREKGAWRLCRDLNHLIDIRGEVFVIDTIEKKGKKAIVKGSLYNILRNQAQDISIDSYVHKRKTNLKRRRHS